MKLPVQLYKVTCVLQTWLNSSPFITIPPISKTPDVTDLIVRCDLKLGAEEPVLPANDS